MSKDLLSSLKIGDEISKNFTIDEGSIEDYGNLTKDPHLLHFDNDFAKSKGFDKTILQGSFMLSLSAGLISKKLIGSDYIIAKLNFNYLKPIYSGNNFTIKIKILKINKKFGVALIQVIIEGKKIIFCKGEISVKLI